jgi:uncharacterized protein (TIGR02466 family)
MLIETFKTPILSINLSISTIKLIEKINKIKKQKGRFISNLNGYQSNDLDKEPVFLPLLKIIEEKANKLAEAIGIKNNLKVVNFWINCNKYGNSNIIHIHPDSIFSGSFYLKVPKESGPIVFRNPAANIVETFWQKYTKDFTKFNSPTWKFFPLEKQLLIFPSWLEHYVEPNNNKKEERISLAFNVC